ncbi:ribonucleoside-diphosphate reductase [Haloarcula nitratireducens]|uniref:Ribonucleoside-diphosphate reductase n=1 Tax=Haloarcula nitratireducens TaxID=2487749 RepID=A0AAW4P8W7_9EURY|nr:ribonucleoside-diphosphate reductase [Halomicroarcula nitratireducens]MBX0294213.1 ribonucleoside-diphosphate reductase [Halomicroarcula nitratireducens]
MSDDTFRLAVDRDDRSFRYYRNAVERHWDPADVDIARDRDPLVDAHPKTFENFRATVAKFGAGERAVTEDLAPLAVALSDAESQAYLSTQLYEEARHLDFFERYWREVVNPVEEARGLDPTSPTDDRWINAAYDELLARTDEAMHRLLESDTPENRAVAYCHYHLTIEGILAQTAYWGLQRSFGRGESDLPTLPGFTEGIRAIRSDEGRHVGFGMSQLKALVADGVDPQLLHDTVNELLPLVQRTTTDGISAGSGRETSGPSAADLQTYAAEKHTERMAQITDESATLPDVETLVALES